MNHGGWHPQFLSRPGQKLWVVVWDAGHFGGRYFFPRVMGTGILRSTWDEGDEGGCAIAFAHYNARMPTLLDQLMQDHGDEITDRISGTLGVSREQAANVLSAAAPVILNRFEGAPAHSESGAAAPECLDSLLDGAGEQMNVRIQGVLGVSPEQAAKVIPLVIPVVLRFLMRRIPYGNAAIPVIASLVQKQGFGSLDELAARVVSKCAPSPDSPGIPTLLGRLAGKYFPSRR